MVLGFLILLTGNLRIALEHFLISVALLLLGRASCFFKDSPCNTVLLSHGWEWWRMLGGGGC